MQKQDYIKKMQICIKDTIQNLMAYNNLHVSGVVSLWVGQVSFTKGNKCWNTMFNGYHVDFILFNGHYVRTKVRKDE